jgi:hypothetical protein
MKLRETILAAFLLAPFAGGARAQGTLVFNGTFDTSAAGWTITNITTGTAYETAHGNPPGDVWLYSQEPSLIPTISQTISGLSPGAVYSVSGDYRKGKGDSPDPSLGVAFNGVFVFELASPPDYDWHSFSFLYTAAAPSEALSLSTQLNGTLIAYAVDNIAMQQVPEPSSSWLICAAGISSALLPRRHRATWRIPER